MAAFRLRDSRGKVRPAASAAQPARNDLIGCLPAAIALGLAAPLAGCAVPVSDDAGPPAAEGEPAPAVVPHWNALIARTGVIPAVRWGERGTPISLFGVLSAPRGSLAGDGARGFLAENARLFQISDLGDLDEQSVVDSPIGTHVAFAQRFEGVLVHGAELTALGAARADKLILQAHFLLSFRATFRDGANALITAAIHLGYSAAEVSSVRTILINRGFGPTA